MTIIILTTMNRLMFILVEMMALPEWDWMENQFKMTVQ